MSRVLPDPRIGLPGVWDRLVGPGMTRAEVWLVLATSFAAALLAGLHLYSLGQGVLMALVGAAIAFDVIGGAVCNTTDTTKRWYHRPSARTTDHMGFIALHVAHICLIAWLFRGNGFDWAYALILSAWLLVSASIVIQSPNLLKSPLAVTLALGAFAAAFYGTGPTPGLEWFVPALFIKLLIGHAVPPHGTGPAT